jgi:long-chain acyl-CoA synthetase
VIVVPVDLRSNIEFVRKIQKQVDAKLIFQTKFKPKSKKTVFVEELLDELEGVKAGKGVKIDGNDIAEIVYTSGTTGEPKGVILTHKNFVSNLNALNQLERIHKNFRFLSVLPLSHVFEQVIGFFIPLSNKATIVYIRTLKASALFEAFQEEKITNTVIVPRLLELIRSGILQKVKNEKLFLGLVKGIGNLPLILRRILLWKLHVKFGNIKYFMVGGAVLDPELEKFYENIGIPILQGFGLTETSPVLTTNVLLDRKVGCVGRIVPGVELKIEEGEVLAKGDSITQGYYKNPKKTKELFKEGWLRTGDLGEMKKDYLYLKGRQKDLIVTAAGVNIYPEDIEAVLNRIPDVKDSCVIEAGGKIHAVLLGKVNAKKVVAEANTRLDESQKIQNYSLWPYEDFPRTTTMKIKKFVVKEFVEKKVKPVIVEKKNKVYAVLSRLTTKKINKNATLQELGLSSIDRVELISLLEQEFNLEIDEEKILPITTVKQIESLVKIRKRLEEKKIFKKWALSMPVRILRFVTQELLWFPFGRIYSWPSIEGKKNLRGLKGPIIFASNHQSHYDIPITLMKLPLRFSQKTAVPIIQEHFFKANLKFRNLRRMILFYSLVKFFNVYPLSQKKGFRKSLEYTGDLIDKGWNILIYPEGTRSWTGKLGEFKQGIGIMAVEMKVPIVPVRVENIIKVLPRWKKWPSFAKTKVKIGKPLIIKDVSYIRATEIIKKAVRDL